MNEDDLKATFADRRHEPAPPLLLTPDAMLAAGQRVRHRRAVTVAIVVTTAAAAIATPVLLGLTVHTGDPSLPIPPGAPPSVVNTVPPHPTTPSETPARTTAPPKP